MPEAVTSPESTSLDLSRVVEHVRRLLIRDFAAPEFFNELLTSLGSNAESAIAAVWMMSETRSLGLYVEQGLTATGLLDDAEAMLPHQKLLVEGCLSSIPLVLPHSLSAVEASDRLILIPIRQGEQQIGVIELFCSESDIDDERDQVLADLTEIGQNVERFLRRLADHEQGFAPEKFLIDFDQFLSRLHESLDLRKIGAVTANELRLLLASDRVTFLERSGRKFRARESSGQSQIHRHSRQVTLLEEITAKVSKTQRQFLFPHGDENLPPQLDHLLSDYLNETSAQMVLIEPVFDRPALSQGSSASQGTTERCVIAAIVFEQFTDSLPNPVLSQNITRCSTHVGLALQNARRHSRLQRVPGLSIAGACWQGMTSSRLAVFSLLLTTIIAIFWSLTVFEQDLKVDCRGRLMPVERQQVFASLDGEVARVFVTESQHVEVGEPLLELVSPELESRRLELKSQMRQKLKERDSIRVELRSSVASQGREQSARLQADYEIVSSEMETLESQLELLSVEQSRLLVTAPLSGTVTTPRPGDRLLHKPVQRGEQLIELMSEQGPWQLELEFPEQRAGHLLDRVESSEVLVEYRMAAFPELVWEGEVEHVSDRTLQSQHYGTAVRVICDIDEAELPQRRIGMDVSAQIHCGPRSLMFVYFGELKEYLHRRWWL